MTVADGERTRTITRTWTRTREKETVKGRKGERQTQQQQHLLRRDVSKHLQTTKKEVCSGGDASSIIQYDGLRATVGHGMSWVSSCSSKVAVCWRRAKRSVERAGPCNCKPGPTLAWLKLDLFFENTVGEWGILNTSKHFSVNKVPLHCFQCVHWSIQKLLNMSGDSVWHDLGCKCFSFHTIKSGLCRIKSLMPTKHISPQIHQHLQQHWLQKYPHVN